MDSTTTALELDPDSILTVELLEAAARPLKIHNGPQVDARVHRGYAFVGECLSDDRPVYGATTGFGPLVTFSGRAGQENQCDSALQHLTAGQGPELPREVVRAAMLTRVWSLSRGLSGISPAALAALEAALATDFTPVVPALGSVGASGDLIPLAYVAQALRGVGTAWVGDKKLPAATALEVAGLQSL